MAGHAYVNVASTGALLDDEVVVVLPHGRHPGRATVGADLHVSGSPVGVDDVCREPVLSDTGLEVDAQRVRDGFGGALTVFPGNREAPAAGVHDGKGIREKIEAVVTASANAAVDNHCCDGHAIGVGDLNTSDLCVSACSMRPLKSVDSPSAVIRVVPVDPCDAIEPFGDGVASERASTAVQVAGVMSSSTRDRPAFELVGDVLVVVVVVLYCKRTGQADSSEEGGEEGGGEHGV